jgi:hypothetical protein
VREYLHLRAQIPANTRMRAASASVGMAFLVRVARRECAGIPHLSAHIPAHTRTLPCKKFGTNRQVNAQKRATLLPGVLRVHARQNECPQTPPQSHVVYIIKCRKFTALRICTLCYWNKFPWGGITQISPEGVISPEKCHMH